MTRPRFCQVCGRLLTEAGNVGYLNGRAYCHWKPVGVTAATCYERAEFRADGHAPLTPRPVRPGG